VDQEHLTGLLAKRRDDESTSTLPAAQTQSPQGVRAAPGAAAARQHDFSGLIGVYTLRRGNTRATESFFLNRDLMMKLSFVSIRKPALTFLLSLSCIAVFAQGAGQNAGGNWTMYEAEDKMTAARKVRFELEADNYLRGADHKPRVVIFCTDGKLSLADFRPNIRIVPPNRPGFWGQPQMEVTVRVDDSHSNHGWNWVNGEFLAMDKGTTRELIGAKIFKVELPTSQGAQIAEFSPADLEPSLVSKACGITPKKP